MKSFKLGSHVEYRVQTFDLVFEVCPNGLGVQLHIKREKIENFKMNGIKQLCSA